MKTRIISAAVGIAVLLAVLICPLTAVFAVCLAALAAVAVWELLHNTGRVKQNSLTAVSMVFAVVEVLTVYGWMVIRQMSGQIAWVSPMHQTVTRYLPLVFLLAYGIFTVLFILRHYASADASVGGWAMFGTLYATAAFGSLAALRAGEHGLFHIVIVLVIPWMSDTGAYFVGTFFGKHKMTPVVSPKKSWEGFFGGWIVSVGSALAAGAIYGAVVPDATVNYLLIAVTTVVLAPLSVCGDLFASVVKRQSGIKDYGNLMPGHGGVMDRFDSVMIIAPVLLALVHFLPLVE